MKRTLLTLALVAAAGTAFAQTTTTTTTPSAGSATVTTPSVGTSTATMPQTGAPAVNTQAVRPGTPNASTGASTGSVQTPMVGSAGATPPSAPNAQGSGSARAKIEADGYKNVSGLTRNADGSWGGKEMRGGNAVDVQVDRRGNVISK